MQQNTQKSQERNDKPKGMGLVEIIVAIAISVVTLTSSVVFSSRLAMRAQQTFVEESVLQLQSIISEQLRLIEQGLKRDVKNNLTMSTGGYLPAAASAPQMTWTQFCSSNVANSHFTTNLPTFSSDFATHTANLLVASGTAVTTPEDGTNLYIFTPVTGNGKFGAFTNVPVEIGLRKSVDSSTSGLGNNITIRTMIRYTLYKKTYYTKPQEIKMIYNLVCA
jgi:hypothetical protein